MIELLKIIVQPVVVERDLDGQIIGEKVGDPVALFTPEALPDYVEALRDSIAKANADQLQEAPNG